MATVTTKILKNQRKRDGTYNVKIRIIHQRKICYLSIHHFVCDKQLDSDFTILDSSINKQLNGTIQKYRTAIGQLNDVLDFYCVYAIKDYLKNIDKDIDFVKFCSEHIRDLLKSNRKGSANTFKTVIYSLVDYFKRNTISPLEINEKELIRYERYLRSERTITRRCNKILVTRKIRGMENAGVHNHMRDLRTLYKEAMRFFNNPQFDDIKIRHCPFDNYKIPDTPLTRKRNIKAAQIKGIRDTTVIANSRAELARDMFMLSFYLCGMNAIDIYNLRRTNFVDGRIEYSRTKTKTRRKDTAFISIKIVKNAEPILEKYVGKLHLKYKESTALNHALNVGLKQLSEINKMPPITFYWARHSFANLARNKCRISEDDVALALNHSDDYHKTTDIYLEKNWNIIDEVQDSVISLIDNY